MRRRARHDRSFADFDSGVADVFLDRGERFRDDFRALHRIADRFFRERGDVRAGDLLFDDLAVAARELLPRFAARKRDERNWRFVGRQIPLEIVECFETSAFIDRCRATVFFTFQRRDLR